MNEWEEIYSGLEKLYSGKDLEIDRFNKYRRVEGLVNSLIKDIVKPLKQKLNIRLNSRDFDGEILLGRGKIILYEIYAASLSKFRYDRILDIVRGTYFPSKRTFFLNVARSFSKNDEKQISILSERTPTNKIKICFIDYKRLIALHKFVKKMENEQLVEKERLLKQLFLTELLESNIIIREGTFDSSLAFAHDRYPFEINEVVVYSREGLQPRSFHEYHKMEERLQKLETLVITTLQEIKDLKNEIRRKNEEKSE